MGKPRSPLSQVRKWVLPPRRCLAAVKRMSRGTWSPWVGVWAKPASLGERYTIQLPGGDGSIRVNGAAATLAVATRYGGFWERQLSAREARYRVLRAAIGSVAEAGLVPARDVERLWVALEIAAGQVEIARAA